MRPGMTNLPARSTVVAPAGALSSATGPTQRIRPSSTVIAEFGAAGPPVPSINVKPVNTTVFVVGAVRSGAGRWQAAIDNSGRRRRAYVCARDMVAFQCWRDPGQESTKCAPVLQAATVGVARRLTAVDTCTNSLVFPCSTFIFPLRLPA